MQNGWRACECHQCMPQSKPCETAREGKHVPRVGTGGSSESKGCLAPRVRVGGGEVGVSESEGDAILSGVLRVEQGWGMTMSPMLEMPELYPAELLLPPLHALSTPGVVLKQSPAAVAALGVPSMGMLLGYGSEGVRGDSSTPPNLAPGLGAPLAHL